MSADPLAQIHTSGNTAADNDMEALIQNPPPPYQSRPSSSAQIQNPPPSYQPRNSSDIHLALLVAPLQLTTSADITQHSADEPPACRKYIDAEGVKLLIAAYIIFCGISYTALLPRTTYILVACFLGIPVVLALLATATILCFLTNHGRAFKYLASLATVTMYITSCIIAYYVGSFNEKGKREPALVFWSWFVYIPLILIALFLFQLLLLETFNYRGVIRERFRARRG